MKAVMPLSGSVVDSQDLKPGEGAGKQPLSGEFIAQLVRPDIAGLEEYTPIAPFEVLSARLGFAPERITKLDANENPYGPSPKALKAIADFPYKHIYPDPGQTLLRDGLEKYLGIDKEHILCGNGSDELLDLILRLVIEPGDAVINCPPTFGMYTFLAGVCGARVVEVPRRADFAVDVEAIAAQFDQRPTKGRIKVIFICRPNNPDGSMVCEADLHRLLQLPALIVVDEAYIEFSGESIAPWVLDYPNLVVLRTFSKWAGLAGLRIGYGLFPLPLMKHLWKIKQPYNINVAAQAAALASLDDVDYLLRNVQRIVAERERLYRLLHTVAYLQPYPSHSNFILCRVVGRSAHDLKRNLEQRGVLLRYYNKPGLDDCIRVSVGTPEQTDVLMDVLQNLR